MADHIAEAVAVYRDDRGLLSTVRFWVDGNAVTSDDAVLDAYNNGNALIDLVTAMTNAQEARRSGIIGTNTTFDSGYGADAQYESCSQGAELVFRDAFAGTHRWVIPAPKVTIFQADGVTVDSADSLVSALVSYVLAHCVTQSGAQISGFVGGRFRSVQRKAERIGLKTPGLT